MDPEETAIAALVSDLEWQIDQLRRRGIKNQAGNPYIPSYYKRGLKNAIERGGTGVADYVRGYLSKPPSEGYKKLETANSLDLACEYLIADETKPYAILFTDVDRTKARERLAPHLAAIEARNAEIKARSAAARAKIREEGGPRRRNELDDALRSRGTR
ncbi:MAG: hypothetical protein JWQ20_1662 [Conexibacter sp.]|nr:hypothetical protein [Solirubrobacterales bacterium]MCW3002364.1 hypothetical protein [Conexibacter sp.]